MSFSDINLHVRNAPGERVSLLLPYDTYALRFKRLGVHFPMQEPQGDFARAKLPKGWSCVISCYPEGKTVYLFENTATLRAKIVLEKDILVEFLK